MRRVLINLALIVGVAILTAWAWTKVRPLLLALPHTGHVAFNSPYRTALPLSHFLVFASTPQANIPDGQIHWVDSEVPGIDVLGPADGEIHNMCPDDGLAWTLQGGDPYGGGTFVAVECSGRATGWQMLAFHLCRVDFPPSADSATRVYTRVAPGAVVGHECGGHTHLSLGYWAAEKDKQVLPCPQWRVQGRYWVNAACILNAQDLSAVASARLSPADDWELAYLKPEYLNPLRRLALFGVCIGLVAYLVLAFLRPPASDDPARRFSPAFEASVNGLIWLGFVVLLIIISAGPVWPVSGASASRFTSDARRYQAAAQAVGYDDWTLLEAFYQVAVPRLASGQPAAAGQAGKVFPPEAAAAIPFGETNAAPWGQVDPTQPGVYGRSVAWEAVALRWPPDFYERFVLGLTVSRQAQRQRQGLEAIASSPAVVAMGLRLGKTIRAQDLYGSEAGAVGRTQILPGHFAPDGVCGDMLSMDVWNDPLAVAECTTRYLTVSGCWGSWWNTDDVWSALCGYNPGAWNASAHQWYWNVLQDRMPRLAAANVDLGLADPAAGPLPAGAGGGEKYVSTPMVGLLVTQALLQGGQSAYRLPGPLSAWVQEAGPYLSEYRPEIRLVYRLFRAWVLIYYSPDDLLMLGIQL